MTKPLLGILLFIIPATLCHAQNPTQWGTTDDGGAFDDGVLFSYDVSTGIETDVHDFGNGTDGQNPEGTLIEGKNGLLYGFAEMGGLHSGGILFSYNISTGTETDLHDFGSGADGKTPYTSLIQVNDSLLYGTTIFGGEFGEGTIFKYNIIAGKETDLHDFFNNGTDGEYPVGTPIQVNDSMLYGETNEGGANRVGIIYSFNILTGKENLAYTFGAGTTPNGSLLLASNGLLYGMTSDGGMGSGNIFSYDIATKTGTDVHNFNDTDGQYPYGSLIQTKDSLLYGMSPFNGGPNSGGLIFSYNISKDTEVILFEFGGGVDGDEPNGSLFQASNGLLYGMTEMGGTKSDGIIFSFDISTGIGRPVFDFDSTDGEFPVANLIEVDSVITTGINQLSVNSNQLSIYPNPTSGQFTIQLNGNQNGCMIEIIDILGQTVLKSPMENLGIINLTSQPAGLYFVYLKTDEGVEIGKVLVTK